ncbi:MAG: hypothetical protein MUO92_02310 [Dehalococcoidales bacterium]|nr:hypothetical protein [Dehalococcoidales bacterium]
MNVTEYLFREYRDLTTSYVEISKRLRELLPTFSNMHESSETPGIKATKRILLDLDKTEDEVQDALQKIRNIKHTLVGML